MDIEELRELFRQLIAQGMKPMLCDTEVPKYDTSVPCGEPTWSAADGVENVLLPRELLSMNPEFLIQVRGDSMKDAGIVAGDLVRVICDVAPSDGDIVLMAIDGEYTLKTYYTDEGGRRWLVPQNEEYEPILLDGNSNVKYYGKVKEVIKTYPRVGYEACRRAIRRSRAAKRHVITQERVDETIIAMAPSIKNGRQWYAVMRPLVDREKMENTDFEGFCQLVARLVPQHEHLPNPEQMSRMAVQSFKRAVVAWDEDDAPVHGKTFYTYKRIAVQTLERLDKE